jgi:hypothetical protein
MGGIIKTKLTGLEEKLREGTSASRHVTRAKSKTHYCQRANVKVDEVLGLL